MLHTRSAVIILQNMIFIVDVDGVLTDGTKTYNNAGECISKRFNDKDFTAIKQLQAAGQTIAIVSGDDWNRKIMEKRNIPFYHSRDSLTNKLICKTEFMKQLATDEDEVVAVGDDIFDLPLLFAADYAYCPWDAHPDLIEHADSDPHIDRLRHRGGEGIIAQIYADLVRMDKITPPTLDQILELDAKGDYANR